MIKNIIEVFAYRTLDRKEGYPSLVQNDWQMEKVELLEKQQGISDELS